MLKGIAACISPALLQVLSEMGCGDTLVLAGANFPGSRLRQGDDSPPGRRCRTLPLLEGILKLLPLDENVPNPVQLSNGQALTEIWPSPSGRTTRPSSPNMTPGARRHRLDRPL